MEQEPLQIPVGRLAWELTLWTGYVTGAIVVCKYFLFPWLLSSFVQHMAPLKHRGWFDRLSARDRSNMCGRIFDGIHHIAVAWVCWMFIQNGDYNWLRAGLYLEFGIDLFDMVGAKLGFPLNGYSGIGVLIHHIVAVLMVPCVLLVDFVEPSLINELLMNLDSSGGIDILVATVLPKTPLFGSLAFLSLSTFQYGLWIWSRHIWFNVLAWQLLSQAWAGNASWPVFLLSAGMFAMLSLFNVVVTLVRGKRVVQDWRDVKGRASNHQEYTQSSERAIDHAISRLTGTHPMYKVMAAKKAGKNWLATARRASLAAQEAARAAAVAAAADDAGKAGQKLD